MLTLVIMSVYAFRISVYTTRPCSFRNTAKYLHSAKAQEAQLVRAQTTWALETGSACSPLPHVPSSEDRHSLALSHLQALAPMPSGQTCAKASPAFVSHPLQFRLNELEKQQGKRQERKLGPC